MGWWFGEAVCVVSVLTFPTAVTVTRADAKTTSAVSDDADNLHILLSKDGGYEVTVGNTTWLTSAPSFFNADGKRYVQNQNLKLVSNKSSEGTDRIGRFVSYTYVYLAGQSEILTSFRKYKDHPLLYFSQGYVTGVGGSRARSVEKTISGFPAFRLSPNDTSSPRGPLGYLAYGGVHCADTGKTFGIFGSNMELTGGLEGGPLLLFDGGGDVLVMSPASRFMAASHWRQTLPDHSGTIGTGSSDSGSGSGSALVYGIMGGVDHVPAGTTVDFVVCYSSRGVNKAMERWGSYLQHVYGRTDSYVKGDPTINYLGYYTDKGAYYYYNTEPKENYQTTMLDAVSYAVQLGIPYRYIQYDSWWYYKGVDKGVKTWEAMPDIFPSGLQYMLRKTGLRPVAHNRYWANDTTYAAQNGGRYHFVLESTTGKAVPLDQTFWGDLLGNASRQWGLQTYEQDWLNVQFEQVPAMLTDLSLAPAWLGQMARGAVSANVTVQYCTSPARHVLHALTTPVVTQARVSANYQPGNGQWKIGVSSLLAHSLGIAPFKDTFWTVSDQPGNKYKAREPNNELQLSAAVLSTGPVGPGDGIGFTNVSLLMRCCNAEGLIMKPSKPATMIDDQIYKRALGSASGGVGEVWTTYSVVSAVQFGVIFVPDLAGPYSVTPAMAGFDTDPGVLYVYEAHDANRTLQAFSQQSPLVISDCRPVRPCVYHTAPVFNHHPAVILLGETDKVVPVSPQRFAQIDVIDNDVILHVLGAPQERVRVAFSVDFRPVTVACVIPASGTAVLDLSARSCQ